MKYCIKCGKACENDAKFCANCGYSFEKTQKPKIESNNNEPKFEWKELNPFIYTYKVYPIGWITLVNLLLGLLKSFALLGVYCSPVTIEEGGVETFMTMLITCGIIFFVLRNNKDKWTDKLAEKHIN